MRQLFGISNLLHPARLSRLAERLLGDEAISGKLILVAVALALLVANTPLFPWYDALLHTKLTIGLGEWRISLDLLHWISEGLMAFFFLVVGLELKRELVHGELRHRQTAILPFAAAIGGMILPALLFAAFNAGKETINGWAIPTATDIALAVGILALLGNRIPPSIRIFILALAIVDDIIAVIVIAVFYSTSINLDALAAMAVIAVQMYLFGKLRLLPMWAFAVFGVVLWLLAFASGIHPSIAGAVLGLIAPMSGHRHPGEQIAERVERKIIPFSTLVVVPLFAFTNTGIRFDFQTLNSEAVTSLGYGIVFGLVFGKLLGIFGASWIVIKLGIAKLPDRSSWMHILGVGSLAGIGFTVAIFVADLSFEDPTLLTAAKLSIFIASVIAAVMGTTILRRTKIAR